MCRLRSDVDRVKVFTCILKVLIVSLSDNDSACKRTVFVSVCVFLCACMPVGQSVSVCVLSDWLFVLSSICRARARRRAPGQRRCTSKSWGQTSETLSYWAAWSRSEFHSTTTQSGKTAHTHSAHAHNHTLFIPTHTHTLVILTHNHTLSFTHAHTDTHTVTRKYFSFSHTHTLFVLTRMHTLHSHKHQHTFHSHSLTHARTCRISVWLLINFQHGSISQLTNRFRPSWLYHSLWDRSRASNVTCSRFVVLMIILLLMQPMEIS